MQYKRKVVSISYSVLMVLPKHWAMQYNIKKGDIITIDIDETGILRINPTLK